MQILRRATHRFLPCLALACLGCGSSGPTAVTAGVDAASNDASASDVSSPQDGGTEADAGSCVISASSYDQSCAVDTDCQEVTSTDYCSVHCLCGGSAVSTGAMAKFSADIAKTPLGSGMINGTCPCPASFGACCRGGRCTATCFSPSDTLPSCADAGGMCFVRRPAGTTCTKDGPPDACAYPDEACCLN